MLLLLLLLLLLYSNYSVFDHIIQRLPELLTKDVIVRSCVKLLCILIDLQIANDIVMLHLTRLTRNMRVWPQEVRVPWFQYYIGMNYSIPPIDTRMVIILFITYN